MVNRDSEYVKHYDDGTYTFKFKVSEEFYNECAKEMSKWYFPNGEQKVIPNKVADFAEPIEFEMI